MRIEQLFVLALCLPVIPAQALTPGFEPGNLSVLRIGNGVATLASSGDPGFLDEYTPNGILNQFGCHSHQTAPPRSSSGRPPRRGPSASRPTATSSSWWVTTPTFSTRVACQFPQPRCPGDRHD